MFWGAGLEMFLEAREEMFLEEGEEMFWGLGVGLFIEVPSVANAVDGSLGSDN